MSETVAFADIHNHLIPGVDDGARSLSEALAALSAMHEQGVRRLVCTPHIDAELINHPARLAARLEKVDAKWEEFREAAAKHFPDVDLRRGHEVMIDAPRFSADEPRVRMAGGPYVLVEFPRLFVPSGCDDVLYQLRLAGHFPIVAHPERYVATGTVDLDLIAHWRNLGAAMIVNAGSLAGGFGKDAHTTAVELVRRGWADMIGSDYHARKNRPLLVRQVWEQMLRWGGEEQARLMLSVNPGRVIDGEPLAEVPPLESAGSWWHRVRQLFGR
jgi:protein-tyrosine phosphatase